MGFFKIIADYGGIWFIRLIFIIFLILIGSVNYDFRSFYNLLGLILFYFYILSSRLACCFVVERWMDEMKIIIGQNSDVIVG